MEGGAAAGIPEFLMGDGEIAHLMSFASMGTDFIWGMLKK
jgi:hypothetical protein